MNKTHLGIAVVTSILVTIVMNHYRSGPPLEPLPIASPAQGQTSTIVEVEQQQEAPETWEVNCYQAGTKILGPLQAEADGGNYGNGTFTNARTKKEVFISDNNHTCVWERQ